MAVCQMQGKLELAVCAIVIIDEILDLLLASRPYCGLESIVIPCIVLRIYSNRSYNCIALLRRNELDILNGEYVLSLSRGKVGDTGQTRK